MDVCKNGLQTKRTFPPRLWLIVKSIDNGLHISTVQIMRGFKTIDLKMAAPIYRVVYRHRRAPGRQKRAMPASDDLDKMPLRSRTILQLYPMTIVRNVFIFCLDS